MSTEERFIAIETKLAFQEDVIQTLNESLISHEQKFSELERRYLVLLDRFNALDSPGDSAAPIDERPPHY